MFKFNFSSAIDQREELTTETTLGSDHSATDIDVIAAHEVKLTVKHQSNAENAQISQLKVRDWVFRHVNLKQVEELLCSGNTNTEASAVGRALRTNSDVVNGVYEGGMKLWECTLDLLSYVLKENISFKGLRVLDLGCGSGLIGILTLLRHASSVHFQDYNPEVLDFITIPNVLLNHQVNQAVEMKFYAGDWGTLPHLLDIYDVILTSETIYNPDSYYKLERVMDSCLKEDGCIYLAAKVTYFGVGGDLRQFESFLKQKKWKSETVFQTLEGVRREVLKLTRM